jgi:pimeloyl-ACP methyl ester carboxylesterase
MSQPHRVLFLPGAAGEGSFWRPVAERLPFPYEPVFFDWPGLGHVAADPHVRGLEDLVAGVVRHTDLPVDIVAHSMGGVIAVRAALERPTMVRRLVLSATSGGIDVSRFQAYDWRPAYRAAYPTAAPWIVDDRTDLSEHLARLHVPTLLLWGDADPVSPVAVGEHLARLIPHARLVVINGGDHTFARDRAEAVASHIAEHLRLDKHRGGSTQPDHDTEKGAD